MRSIRAKLTFDLNTLADEPPQTAVAQALEFHAAQLRNVAGMPQTGTEAVPGGTVYYEVEFDGD